MQKKLGLDVNTGLLNEARQCPSPNFDDRPDSDISLIVIHNISLPPGKYGEDWIDRLFANKLPENAHPFFTEIYELRVSSHILIRRDGEVVQYVPFNKRAWHAGISSFRGREACNDFSIGIELEGTDDEAFTEIQYVQLEHVIKALRAAYPSLKKGYITGHQHIAPERKTDPGAYFNWQQLSASLNEILPADAREFEQHNDIVESVTIIDLLRHGEPVGGRMYRGGGTDHPLSSDGWAQMWSSVASYVSSEGMVPWKSVVSSPMSRCCVFADELSKQYQLPLVIKGDLQEAGYGSWEGRTPDEIEANDYDEYWAFFADPVNNRPSNAEPLAEFTERVSKVLNEVLVEYAGQHVLLVSHLAVTRAIIAEVLSFSLANQQLIDLPFAGMLRLIKDKKGLRILFR
ncbi:MAG TPA: 1,6-anhydro-N-acetylmuramyl-L-alanine amidase AmpD [Leucothrix mucor]|nr:1,6-anhydro-N-acetylmuramyl-L-alanine amidase AmpD [Leucothrix mucor]